MKSRATFPPSLGKKSKALPAKHSEELQHQAKEIKLSFYKLRFRTPHKSCTSELPNFAKSERSKWFNWLFLEPDSASLGESLIECGLTGGGAEGTGQQCRTVILCVTASVEELPVTFTERTTSISLVASHHQFCCTPSTNSSCVKKSSWCTATSIVSPGSMRPIDGWTYLTLQSINTEKRGIIEVCNTIRIRNDWLQTSQATCINSYVFAQ